MRCENKTFLQNDPGFLQEISSTAVEVGLSGLIPRILHGNWFDGSSSKDKYCV